jgi:glycine cleavage system H protein
MIALLVVITFLAAVVIDHLILRQPVVVKEDAPPLQVWPRVMPPVVAGFNVPESLSYHPGHTWARGESAELVRIGVDDFAAKVAGDVHRIDVPKRGQWIRQGQRIIAMQKDGMELDFVSPIEGTIVDINENVMRNPRLAHDDPYGEGWLMTVNSPDAKTNFRNLLHGTVARRWMDDAAAKLRTFVVGIEHATAHDGGVAETAVFTQIPEGERVNAAKELFLN